VNIKDLRLKNGLSQQQLAEKTGIPKGRINNWEQGNGQPKAKDYKLLEDFFNSFEMKPSQMKIEKGGKSDYIPFYDAIAVGGLGSLEADQTPLYQPSEMINPGTWFRTATAALRVCGDSMFPKYRPGCVVALKEIFDKTDLDYGQDYVIETDENRYIKRIMKSDKEEDGFIEFTSYSTSVDTRGKLVHAPRDFHKDKIRRIYRVLGQVLHEAGGDIIIHK
jgi:transcriptional regulator with XRE-family HTH domain